MPTILDSDPEEEYELLDISGSNGDWFKKLTRSTFGDISKQSAAKQVAVGSMTGIVTFTVFFFVGSVAGYLFVKVGKVAAATLGTSVLLIQVAQHQGYIQINWDRVRASVRQAEREVQRKARRHYQGVFQNFRDFVQQNLFLAASFGGGFLVGIAI